MTLPKQKKRKPVKLFLFVAIIAAGFFLWHKPDKHVEAQHTPPKPAFTVQPEWPTDARASAVGALGYGVLASHGDDKPRPIASIAKVITALAILEKHPLANGEAGPYIDITEHDEQLYRDYVAQNGTVVLVKAGVPITERDAIEAMLLPSANNVADTAAIWAFGSLSEYRAYANGMLKRYGLSNTTVGTDASGLDPSTKSTASDLIKIAEHALNNKTIADIAALHSAEIPFAGTVPNYNAMVTRYGYTGLKPGESIEAGNTLLFSTKETINGKDLIVIGAVLGTENYRESNADALQLVDSVKKTLQPTGN